MYILVFIYSIHKCYCNLLDFSYTGSLGRTAYADIIINAHATPGKLSIGLCVRGTILFFDLLQNVAKRPVFSCQ